MVNIYSTNKIIHHPEIIEKLRKDEQPNPVQIHLMPDNRCMQNCIFCSYRLKGNKNTELFDRKSYIPKGILVRLLDDFKIMGGKAIEITGGGEPLLYPCREDMFRRIIEHGFDYSLVTNGSLLDRDLAKLIAPQMIWARISIDAGRATTYANIRHAKEEDFGKALNAISLLRSFAKNPQFKLGVGFVINNENYKEVYEGCRLAKQFGADNVRISTVFHPHGLSYFKQKTLKIGSELSKKAKAELDDSNFSVYNIFDERIKNVQTGRQDYKFCGTKELLCVVGGNCDVYTCCSLAFNRKGLIGSLKVKSFNAVWNGKTKRDMFRKFDARKICNIMCLYESRNRFINSLLDKNPFHKNFI